MIFKNALYQCFIGDVTAVEDTVGGEFGATGDQRIENNGSVSVVFERRRDRAAYVASSSSYQELHVPSSSMRSGGSKY